MKVFWNKGFKSTSIADLVESTGITRGRLIVNIASELTTHGEQVKRIVHDGLGEFDAFSRRSIKVVQARKEIPRSLDAAATAKALLVMIVAIRVPGCGT